MERREARIGKKESELESADDGRRRPKQRGAGPLIGEQGNGDAKQKDIAADRQRAERIERAADGDHPQAPARPARKRGDRKPRDRKSVGEGTSVSVRVDLGGRRIIQKKTKYINTTH